MPAPHRRQGEHFWLEWIGLDPFLRDLRRIRPHEADVSAGKWLVREIVATAQGSALAQGGVASKSARDIRVHTVDSVKYGGMPYSMGAEFGAIRYKQFRPWRGNKDDAGYFLWPTVRHFRDRSMLQRFMEEHTKRIKIAFPE